MDYAGSALASSSQLEEVYRNLAGCVYGNPHSKGPTSKRSHDMINEARSQVLDFFGTSNAEYDVVFTAGATSSLKLLGECLPVDLTKSHFAYALNSHTSVLGLRSYFNETCTHSISPRSIRSSLTSSSCSTALSELSSSVFHLLALPGECNFSGAKYNLSSIAQVVEEANSGSGWSALVQRGWSISDNEGLLRAEEGTLLWLLDAAKLVATSPLHLSSLPAQGRPHFVIASFYKIFGYPTGIGVLLLRRDVAGQMIRRKPYYGGGTVVAVAADSNYMSRGGMHGDFYDPHRFLEDGTPNYHGISALRSGFGAIERAGGMDQIQKYTYHLASELATRLLHLRHAPLPGHREEEGTALCELYGAYADKSASLETQGVPSRAS